MNESQLEMQEKINNAQIEMQRIQLKQNLYEKRKEVYDALSQIFKFCDGMEYVLNISDDLEYKYKNYLPAFDAMKRKYLLNNIDYIKVLSHSKHLFSKEIFEKIERIETMFSIVLSTSDEIIENKDDKKKDYRENAIDASICCIKRINEYNIDTMPLIEKEMDISNTGN